MPDKKKRKKGTGRKTKTKRYNPYLFIPMAILIVLLSFAIIQKIGEVIGIFPIIMLSTVGIGSENVIFFQISLGFSIFVGLMISIFLWRKLNR